jgi:glycosyltransferase involved in cell wall biosynthesis
MYSDPRTLIGSLPLKKSNVFLMSNFRGWILEALAVEAAKAVDVDVNVQYIPVSRREIRSISSLKAKFRPEVNGNNMFVHHRTFLEVDKRFVISGSCNRVWLTHFDELCDINQLILRESRISKAFVQNTQLKESLVSEGFPESKLRVIPGAVERSIFHPSQGLVQEGKYFLFSGDCKPRKNPSYVHWIVSSFPEYQFVIHGSGWRLFDDGVLNTYRNVRILDFDFGQQPVLLRGALALISVAEKEGGPISILEALASGTPVLATDTGFARDLLSDDSGYLVFEDRNLNYWATLLKQAAALKELVRDKDLLNGKFSWAQLGADFYL